MIITLITRIESNAQSLELKVDQGNMGFQEMARFFPDGKHFATVSKNIITIREATTGREINKLTRYIDDIQSIVVSPDGKAIVSAGTRKLIVFRKIETDDAFKIFKKLDQIVYSMSFSPDGRFLLSQGTGRINIWNVESEEIIQSYDADNGVFSPDGHYLLIFKGRTMTLLNREDGSLVRTFMGRTEFSSAKFSPDGKLILSSSKRGDYPEGTTRIHGSLVVWSTETGEQIQSFKAQRVFSMDVSPDGKYIVTGTSPQYGTKENDIRVMVWDIQTGELERSFGRHEKNITSLEVSSNGKVVLSRSNDSVIKLWDFKTGFLIKELRSGSDNLGLALFSPTDEAILSVIGKKGLIKLLDPGNGKILKLFKARPGVSAVRFSNNGEYFVSASHGKRIKVNDKWIQPAIIEFWSVNDDQPLRRLNGHEDVINSIDISADNKTIVTGSNDDTAILWSLETNSIIKVLTGHRHDVNAVRFSPDEKHVASASEDGQLILWEARSGEMVKSIRRDPTRLFSIDFSKDSRFVVAAAAGGDIRMFNVETGELFKTFRGQDSHSTTVSISPDFKYIVTGSRDNFDHRARVWHIPSGRLVGILKGHNSFITSTSFSSDGKLLVTGSGDGTWKMWKMQSKELLYTHHSFRNQDWVFVSPQNYFMGTKKGARSIYYTKGLTAYSFDQFDLIYNRPDLLMKNLGWSTPALVEAYRQAYIKRLKRMGFDEETLEGYLNYDQDLHLNAPSVIIDETVERYISTDEKTISIPLMAFDPNQYLLNRLIVNVNGVPLFGAKGKELKNANGQKLETTIEVPLNKGSNRIGIRVLNEEGILSLEEIIYVQCLAEYEKPDLYIVALGVSEYKDSLMNLRYAAKDAQDITSYFDSNDSFNDIKKITLLNEQVNLGAIIEVKKELAKSKINDQVVLYYAGHGLIDEKYNYFLATYGMEFDNPKKGGLPYEQFQDLLDGIPARKKLLLIDACHSGEIDKEKISSDTVSFEDTKNIVFRGFKSYKKSDKKLGLPDSFELMKELFNDLKDGTGSVVISASGGLEFAYESPDWGNGVFTFSILEGLKNTKVDLNGDGQVLVSELKEYTLMRVLELTKGMQRPTVRTENLEYDYVIWKY